MPWKVGGSYGLEEGNPCIHLSPILVISIIQWLYDASFSASAIGSAKLFNRKFIFLIELLHCISHGPWSQLHVAWFQQICNFVFIYLYIFISSFGAFCAPSPALGISSLCSLYFFFSGKATENVSFEQQ